MAWESRGQRRCGKAGSDGQKRTDVGEAEKVRSGGPGAGAAGGQHSQMKGCWGGPDFLLSLDTLSLRCSQDMPESGMVGVEMGMEL